jgi:hypothetical protein
MTSCFASEGVQANGGDPCGGQSGDSGYNGPICSYSTGPSYDGNLYLTDCILGPVSANCGPGSCNDCAPSQNGQVTFNKCEYQSVSVSGINITDVVITHGSAIFSAQNGGNAIYVSSGISVFDNGLINTGYGNLFFNGGSIYGLDSLNANSVVTNGDIIAYGQIVPHGGIIYPASKKTATYPIQIGDEVIFVTNTSSTPYSVTLPTASGIGQKYTIKKTDSNTNAITVATSNTQTIDGATTYSLAAAHKYITVVSDGNNWQIVANN